MEPAVKNPAEETETVHKQAQAAEAKAETVAVDEQVQSVEAKVEPEAAETTVAEQAANAGDVFEELIKSLDRTATPFNAVDRHAAVGPPSWLSPDH